MWLETAWFLCIKELKAAESSAAKIQELQERFDLHIPVNLWSSVFPYSLQYSEQRAADMEQEINRLQQLLYTRSQENNSLNFQIENIAKSFHLSQEQIQLMIQQALNQQQLQSVLYQCDHIREQLNEKNRVITDLERELTQFQKLRENNFASDEVKAFSCIP